jgi:cofilin
LVNDLPPDDVRFAIYVYEFKADDGTDRNKLVFITWAPEPAPAKRKMIMVTIKQLVRFGIPGIAVEIIAEDRSDLLY